MERIRNFITWWNRPNKSVFAEYLQAFIVIVPIAFVIRTWGYGLYKVPTGSMETTLLVGESFVSDKFSYTFLQKPKKGDIIAFNDPQYCYSSNTLVNLWENYVWGPQNFTKRIIGEPGDHVEGKVEEGKPVIYLNEKKLDEPYLNKYPLVFFDLKHHPRSYHPDYSYEKQPFYRMNGPKVRQIKRLFESQGRMAEIFPGTPMVGGTNSDIFDVHLKSKDVDGIDEYWVMGDNRLGSSDSRTFGPLPSSFIHGKIVFRLFSVDSSTSWMIFDLLLHPFDFWTRVRWSRWMQFVK